MNDFYKLLNIQFKEKNEIPDIWGDIIDQIDDFILEFLGELGINIDFLYTTNVGILNAQSTSENTILWDLSYWVIYRKYLEFIFWMNNEKEDLSGEPNYPLDMKENIFKRNNSADACRLVFLGTIFEYLAYKFYNNEDLSYCFALLFNENKSIMPHEICNDEFSHYDSYILEQLMIAKLFCAFHEGFHLKKLDHSTDVNEYHQHVLYNLKTIINSEEFRAYYNYDLNLVDITRKRINCMNEKDPLLDELCADAGALDYIDLIFNYLDIIQPKWTLEKFASVVTEAIENFYAFNTLTYELYFSWDVNIKLAKGQITEDVYKKEFQIKDTEDVIRSQMFPVVLWKQIEGFLQNRGEKIKLPTKRHVNSRKEMTSFFNIAYNYRLKEAIIEATKVGFDHGKLTTAEARDVLLEWNNLDKYPNASVKDLFLKGGITNGIDFVMFVRGY